MSETHAIRESLLEIVGRNRRPKPPTELFSALRDEWGHVCERRLQRALAWLVERGAVERVGIRYRGEYRRTATELNVAPERQRCSSCRGERHNSATCDNHEVQL